MIKVKEKFIDNHYKTIYRSCRTECFSCRVFGSHYETIYRPVTTENSSCSMFTSVIVSIYHFIFHSWMSTDNKELFVPLPWGKGRLCPCLKRSTTGCSSYMSLK